jgi:hypothetical protein
MKTLYDKQFKMDKFNALDLDKIYKFFANPKKVPMPEELLFLTINKGTGIKFGDLETEIGDLSNLSVYSHDIINKIPKGPRGEKIAFPTVRKTVTSQLSEHYVYHPESGEFLGEYKVNIPF